MKKLLLIAFVSVLSFSLSGCATLFARKTNSLNVISSPAGADVYVNGFKMGTTPVELALKPDKTYTIEYRKEGYENVVRVVNTKVGAGWIILDVLGGLIRIIVDVATGDWKKLDQKSVNAALEKQN